MPPRPFAGQTVLITGASSGIGHAAAHALAAAGARLALVARRADLLAGLAGGLRAKGTEVAWAAADVSDRSGLLRAIGLMRQEIGPIDRMLACAGVGTPTLLEPMNTPDIEAMIRVNLLGMIYTVEAVLPEMLERRKGQIAVVSSLAADRGLPGESGYCASKAGVNCYLEGLRVQLRGRGVTVCNLCPGFVATPMTAVNDFHMPFLMTAEQAAQAILRGMRLGRKVHRFPMRMALLSRLMAWLPDRAIARLMASYNDHPPMNDLGTAADSVTTVGSAG